MPKERPGYSSRIEDGLLYSRKRSGNYRKVETAGPQPKGPKKIERVATNDADVLRVLGFYVEWQKAPAEKDTSRKGKFDRFFTGLQELNALGKRKIFFDALGIKEDSAQGLKSGWGSTKEERRKKN